MNESASSPSNLSPAGDRLLRISEVESITAASRRSIYTWISAGHFPKPRRAGPRASRWLASEISEWISGTTSTPLTLK